MNIEIKSVKTISGFIYKLENKTNCNGSFTYYKVDSHSNPEEIEVSKKVIGKIRYKGVINIPKSSYPFFRKKLSV